MSLLKRILSSSLRSSRRANFAQVQTSAYLALIQSVLKGHRKVMETQPGAHIQTRPGLVSRNWFPGLRLQSSELAMLIIGRTLNMIFHSIVAIHGLDGHRTESWTAGNNILWLRDLLPDKVPTARILTYGYDANTRGKAQLTNQTILDHAETLVTKLVLFRKETSVRRVVKLPKHLLTSMR